MASSHGKMNLGEEFTVPGYGTKAIQSSARYREMNPFSNSLIGRKQYLTKFEDKFLCCPGGALTASDSAASSPVLPLSWWLSSAGRASALQAEGRRFESVSHHQALRGLHALIERTNGRLLLPIRTVRRYPNESPTLAGHCFMQQA